MSLQVRRVAYSLGAEVSGVDLRQPLDEATFKAIHAAFLEHSVLVFHGQPLTREQHIAFSRRFGTLDRNEAAAADKKAERMPELSLIISRPKPDGSPATGRYSGQEWHTDRSHLPTAALASLLRCIEVPDIGGDTMFANMYRAYDTLTDGMKKMIDGLYGVHMEGRAVIDTSTPEREAESRRVNPCAAHPVVRVHRETGRKALYISEQCKILVGMTADESRPIIKYLSDHAVRPQGVYRHHWHRDDLVMWDNRCTLHMALGDYDRTKVRHMERTTVNDVEPSGYVYTGPLL
jgi:taurine dioxygenase